jgi:transcriptional regulator with XRE-family HTH domain
MPKGRSLGAAIRTRRTELGLTQEQLAHCIGGGIKQAEISRLESGQIALPRRARLERISVALDISLGELLARSGWMGTQEAFAATCSIESYAPRAHDVERSAISQDATGPADGSASLQASMTGGRT